MELNPNNLPIELKPILKRKPHIAKMLFHGESLWCIFGSRYSKTPVIASSNLDLALSRLKARQSQPKIRKRLRGKAFG